MSFAKECVCALSFANLHTNAIYIYATRLCEIINGDLHIKEGKKKYTVLTTDNSCFSPSFSLAFLVYKDTS